MIQKDEVRESIIAIASRIFGKFGFKKTTMDEIAEAARKGKSSLYYYFKNKEDVFRAVVESEAQQLKQKLENAIAQSTDPREQLRFYCRTRIEGFKDLANLYDAIRNDYLTHLDFIEKVRQKYDNEEIIMVRNILVEGVAKNYFDVEDTYSSAIAIVIAMRGLEIPLFRKKQEQIDQSFDYLMNILFYGINKR